MVPSEKKSRAGSTAIYPLSSVYPPVSAASSSC
jgi:hypothetical protein